MPQLDKSSAERVRQLEEIKAIALHTGKELEVVAKVYEEVLEELKRTATVRDFLWLFAARRARERLRARPSRASAQFGARAPVSPK